MDAKKSRGSTPIKHHSVNEDNQDGKSGTLEVFYALYDH